MFPDQLTAVLCRLLCGGLCQGLFVSLGIKTALAQQRDTSKDVWGRPGWARLQWLRILLTEHSVPKACVCLQKRQSAHSVSTGSWSCWLSCQVRTVSEVLTVSLLGQGLAGEGVSWLAKGGNHTLGHYGKSIQ